MMDIPLSFAQRRLWFLAQAPVASAAYHLPWAVRLRGHLDVPALPRPLDALAARHESLRTRIVTVDGEAFQRIDPPDVGFPVQRHDSRNFGALQREETTTEFDLASGPLARGRLIRCAPDDHVLLLTLHHIIGDDWSLAVLGRELGILSSAFHDGQPDPLPPLPLQYADYAA